MRFSITVQPDFGCFLVCCELTGISGWYSVFTRYIYFAAIYFYFQPGVCHHWLELDPPHGSGFFHIFLFQPSVQSASPRGLNIAAQV